jgi:pimeloyl-ACP methyl ester carboxylesterase
MAFARNGSCELWYESIGDGPPVLLLYGIGANSRRWWPAFPGALARRYHVVLTDNRGVGRSSHPEEAWTMDDVVADIAAVAEAAHLETFHLLGCSLGSVFARHFAATHGDRLRSLTLFCPPNGTPATPEDMRLGIFWDPGLPRVENERRSWVVVHPQRFIDENEALLLADFESAEAERTPARTFRFQLNAVAMAPDPHPALNTYTWPVLIVHGEGDRLVPPVNAFSLAQALPRARLHVIPGASHNFWQHAPAETADVTLAFLDEAERNWRNT